MEPINGTQEQITANIIVSAATAAAKAVAEAASAAATVMANENSTSSTAIAVLENKMNTLQNQQTSFEGEVNRRMDKLDLTFEKIFAELREISKGRPSWAVTAIITILTAACGILATMAVLR
jgi:hypothetical protein